MRTIQLHECAWYQKHNCPLQYGSLCQWQNSRIHYTRFSRALARQTGHEHATLTVIDLSSRLTPYTEAWDLQKQLLGALINAEDICTPAGFLVLVQHTPVYTLGSGSSFEHLGFSPNDSPFPLYRTERGGEVTYHGPGQLVAYPVINLRYFNQDLHWYLRSLEEVVIRCLGEVSGLKGERVPGLTGVWVDNKKVAAIGVRAQRWVTYHGLAINIANDLQPFQLITPCGIGDRKVTTVKALLASGDDMSRSDSSPVPGLPLSLRALNDHDIEMVSEYAYALKCAFSEVHTVKLQEMCLENAASLPAAVATCLKPNGVL